MHRKILVFTILLACGPSLTAQSTFVDRVDQVTWLLIPVLTTIDPNLAGTINGSLTILQVLDATPEGQQVRDRQSGMIRSLLEQLLETKAVAPESDEADAVMDALELVRKLEGSVFQDAVEENFQDVPIKVPEPAESCTVEILDGFEDRVVSRIELEDRQFLFAKAGEEGGEYQWDVTSEGRAPGSFFLTIDDEGKVVGIFEGKPERRGSLLLTVTFTSNDQERQCDDFVEITFGP